MTEEPSIKELVREAVDVEDRKADVDFVEGSDEDELPDLQAQRECLTLCHDVRQFHGSLSDECSNRLFHC